MIYDIKEVLRAQICLSMEDGKKKLERERAMEEGQQAWAKRRPKFHF